MATQKTIWVNLNGRAFQVFVGSNGLFYLHDPGGHLDAPHVALPADRVTAQDGRLGLSQGGAIAESVVPAALSFVPVVGPVLGPLASVVGSVVGNMFGGNDPTPADQLVQKVVQLRQGIFALNQQLGIPDQMPVLTRSYAHPYDALPMILELWPQNAGISDNNHWTCDWTGVNCPGCGNMRKCLYAAINKLTPIYQGKQQQVAAAAQQAQVKAAVAQAVAAVAPAVPAPIPTTSPVPIAASQPAPSYAGGAAINYGSPSTDPSLNPPPIAAPAPLVSAGFGPAWLLPLLLIGFPVTMGLVMGSGETKHAPVKVRRHAA
jgi:hypothetical protein